MKFISSHFYLYLIHFQWSKKCKPVQYKFISLRKQLIFSFEFIMQILNFLASIVISMSPRILHISSQFLFVSSHQFSPRRLLFTALLHCNAIN